MRVALASVIAAAVLVACGGSGESEQAAARRSSATSTTSTLGAARGVPSSTSPDTVAKDALASSGPARSPGATSPVAGPAATTTTLPELEMTMEVSPSCVERGGVMSVRVRTRRFASIAAAAIYSDDDSHGNFTIGSADATGRWSWTFVVPREAPTGRAEVGVSAQDRTPVEDGHGADTTGEEAARTAPFEVKGRC